ncbi:MAG: GGDEF domain-containing protein [Desulfovibrio sp.]|jgi:diguanylate cyclase (GGDEF)-like protein|nr:GGDEF domain-containing protein [Desulfovibrio sp.]
MESNAIATKILKNLDIAVLQRIGPGQYALVGDPPPFYSRIFPPDPEGPCNAPWRHSAMLEFFYDLAEDFFASQEHGSLNSGTWEEEGFHEANQALSAEAMSFDTVQVITVRLLQDAYTERVAVLRKAREQLLERRLLTNDLENYKLKARTDGLTKIFNRTAFTELLAVQIVRAETQKDLPLSLIMLDIDNFKQINDTYGHPTGDLVLASLGQILLSSLRRDDIIARYGGEEFITLLPFASGAQAARIAEKLRVAVEEHTFGNLPGVTVSVGYTAYKHGDTMETFIQRADLALYDAKHSGKNTVRER